MTVDQPKSARPTKVDPQVGTQRPEGTLPAGTQPSVIQPKGVQAGGTKRKKKRKRHRSRRARFIIGALQFAVACYAALLLGLVMMETRLVYPAAFDDSSSVAMVASPNIETVQYSSTEGVTLQGRLLPRPSSNNFLLYFHGNAVKAKQLDTLLERLSETFDATAMIAEYRGFEDDRTPTEKGVLADCFAARDYFCERYEITPRDLILYGCSLGGGCAVAVASQGGAKAMVLERTFDRMVNVAADRYPFVPVHLLMRNRYDSIAKLTVYKDPLVVVHGTDDSIISIDHGKRLFTTSGSPKKQWIPVEGLDHLAPLPPQTLDQIAAQVKAFTSDQ